MFWLWALKQFDYTNMNHDRTSLQGNKMQNECMWGSKTFNFEEHWTFLSLDFLPLISNYV